VRGDGRPVRLVIAAILSFALVAPLSLSAPFAAPRATALTYVRVSSLTRNTPANWIKIPRVGISLPIREGNPYLSPSQISSRYAYHYPGTYWPGGRSNTFLYAHARTGAFLKLKYVVKGDLITVRLATGAWVKYRVTGKYNVAWNATSWILPTSSERLTLQTCLGWTRYARKLIVTAVPAY
jgi:LPXTG-site transpeptidase (sortase) family protein